MSNMIGDVGKTLTNFNSQHFRRIAKFGGIGLLVVGLIGGAEKAYKSTPDNVGHYVYQSTKGLLTGGVFGTVYYMGVLGIDYNWNRRRRATIDQTTESSSDIQN